MPLKREKEIKLPDLRMKRGIKEMYMFEIGDAFFHHDSMVPLPSNPDGGENSMKIIANIYKYMDKDPDKSFRITGHTDTTGSPRYNFLLSLGRAYTVVFLLDGDRPTWVEACNSKHKVEDYQQILKHYANLWGWDCDPEEIDDKDGPKTKNAVRQFQEKYNQEFGYAIKVDGIVGEETWGAFFDCYMKELADEMGTTIENLREYRDKAMDVMDRCGGDIRCITCPCGESHPIEEPERDNYKSQTNRRVEVLFFNKNEEPEQCPQQRLILQKKEVATSITISCFKDEICNIEKDCPIYKNGLYKLKKASL